MSAELRRAAEAAGARISTGHRVAQLEPRPGGVGVRGRAPDGGAFVREADWVLSGVAPAMLSALCGDAAPQRPVGAQLKINMVLSRLPELRSGLDPPSPSQAPSTAASPTPSWNACTARWPRVRRSDPWPGRRRVRSTATP